MLITSKKIIAGSLFAILLVSGFVLFRNVVLAQTATPDLGLAEVGSSIGLPTTDIRLVVARIIRIALGVLGIVAVVLIIYAGFTWMTAGGDEEKISQAKRILLNSVIGLAIILSSFAIASFVINRLVSATSNQSSNGGVIISNLNNPYFPSGIFYVDSLPEGGQLCTRNIHPAVTFNRPVDLDSLANNLVILTTEGDKYPGKWELLNENTSVFVPEGDCGEGIPDCFAPSTQYTLHFQNPSDIKTADGLISLSCSIKVGCNDVKFISGEGVDRLPPQIEIEPIANDSLHAGAIVPITVNYTDDNGVQKVDLSADNYFVGSAAMPNCQKSGSVTINWPTAAIATGKHLLTATAYDWAALSARTSTEVNIKPEHCFDNELQVDLGEQQVGPPACGAECGACAGVPCVGDVECGGGLCDDGIGVCVDRMRINGVSPLSGGPGTLVTISGNYFGNIAGKVFVNNSEANLAPCGAASWKPWQIIVEIPAGAASGPIRVETASDAKGRSMTDITNDDFGPKIDNFEVNNITHPGLCAINPGTGLPGAEVSLTGKRLGDAPGKVLFGQQNALVNLAGWTDVLVKTKVPQIESGPWGVKVSQNNVESNALRFFVEESANDSSPIISSISPGSGAKGEYITIIGKNFGNQLGRIWFKEDNNGQPGDAIEGDFKFPPGCVNNWTDTQIIVKFPAGSGEVGKSYFVQARPADALQNPSLIGPTFSLIAGQPAPGICSISPVSGPIPFVEDNKLHIVGEYFGEDPEVYFWSATASSTSMEGRLVGNSSPVKNLVVGQSLDTVPPAGTQTWPVVITREPDKKISNPINFDVLNCVQNNNTCTVPNTHCCLSGGEAGLCRPNNELCEGETLSAGYIWRFSTKDIPKIPHVIERCEDATDDSPPPLPSPSPSILWDSGSGGEHHNICRTASVAVEFSLPNINHIAKTDLLVNECEAGTINEAKNTCTVLRTVPVSQDEEIAQAEYFVPQASTPQADNVVLNLDDSYNNGKWKDKTWYQVVLKSTITAGQGANQAPLSKDRPCGPDSAYCFVFQTGAQDCRMKQVIVTPYNYWTSVLEEPIKKRQNPADDGIDVVYSGYGLSTQRCVLMDTSMFNWSWKSIKPDYVDIFSSVRNTAKVSALANTVGVGLIDPDNAVNIRAEAKPEAGVLTYEGFSPLTVDLNDPEVLDFWPKCVESCTNAEVGVRFNTTMSNRNLPGSALSGPIKLLKCVDENCFNTMSALASEDVVLDEIDQYKVLKLANSTADSVELEPNTIYQVVISASTTDTTSEDLLWSAARLGDPETFSKPYNKEFTWKFKTKKEKCKITRVDIAPSSFTAEFINDKKVYNAQPYSSPDSCDALGQKLNPWSVDWDWKSADALAAPNVVARVSTFSSKGNSPYCTKSCVMKGSSLPITAPIVAICGNNKVEAGEDCDGPSKIAGCGLNCRRLGNFDTATCSNGIIEPNLGETCDPGLPETAVGCSKTCLRTGSQKSGPADRVGDSVCGNGLVGSGEDCDLGIDTALNVPTSSMGCADNCTHQGTRLASNWCLANRVAKAGFTEADFNTACRNAISRCGNGVQDPDEDEGCDLGEGEKSDDCNNFCLFNSVNHPECIAGSEGCGAKRQRIGASLLYSIPSLCGDGVVGVGEDVSCEQNLINNHDGTNPWALVTGVGLGAAAGVPPAQKTDIIGITNENTAGGPVSDSGQFSIPCGFTSDVQCEERMGDGWGVGANSCCYKRPELIEVFPGTTTADHFNICPNTAIEATFNEEIDVTTLKNNFIVARGTTDTTCGASEDVTSLAFSSQSNTDLPWYKRALAYVSIFLRNLIGQSNAAVRDEVRATKWCLGEDSGQVDVEKIGNNQSRVVFRLNKPLALDTDYLVVLKDGLRSQRGISIGKNANNKAISWKFITGAKVCEIDKVSVNPPQVYFGKADATSTVYASVYNGNTSRLQPIPGHYAWHFLWQPTSTDQFIALPTTSSVNLITAKNRNGVDDLRASAVITENVYSQQVGLVASEKTHVIVFLCENPWPPKSLLINGDGPHTIFPYEDKINNNDGFNLNAKMFDNTAIPAAPSGGYFNFRTYYCADNGRVGIDDDLPYLYPAVQVSPAVVSDSPTSSLKRFIFTNNKNTDGMGVQVFSNPKHLSVLDWFKNDRASGGQGFVGEMQATKIDGYDAITDGNNIYVDALNFSDNSHNLFSNIYLFSINADAKTETRRVFEQMIGNLKFNTNLTNYGYCGTSIATPGVSTTCRIDLDCAPDEVCSVQTDKLKRNYQRLRDLREIQDLFGP